MKRHLVMDLFWGPVTEEIGEWHALQLSENWVIQKGLPECEGKGCKLKVRLNDGTETFAYFYKDKAQWIEKYGLKPCYFWQSRNHEPLFDVTHWKALKDDR